MAASPLSLTTEMRAVPPSSKTYQAEGERVCETRRALSHPHTLSHQGFPLSIHFHIFLPKSLIGSIMSLALRPVSHSFFFSRFRFSGIWMKNALTTSLPSFLPSLVYEDEREDQTSSLASEENSPCNDLQWSSP